MGARAGTQFELHGSTSQQLHFQPFFCLFPRGFKIYGPCWHDLLSSKIKRKNTGYCKQNVPVSSMLEARQSLSVKQSWLVLRAARVQLSFKQTSGMICCNEGVQPSFLLSVFHVPPGIRNASHPLRARGLQERSRHTSGSQKKSTRGDTGQCCTIFSANNSTFVHKFIYENRHSATFFLHPSSFTENKDPDLFGLRYFHRSPFPHLGCTPHNNTPYPYPLKDLKAIKSPDVVVALTFLPLVGAKDPVRALLFDPYSSQNVSAMSVSNGTLLNNLIQGTWCCRLL